MRTVILLTTFLAASIATAEAQSRYQHEGYESRYPVYEQVEEARRNQSHCFYTDGYNPGGAAVGAVIGYAIGREFDRDGRRGYYSGGYGYVPGRGGYYNDRRGGYYRGGYESRAGRYGGAVVGGVIGSQYGRGNVVCNEDRGTRFYRNELTGYRVVVRYPDGSSREYFEPVR
jgi:uncharacterized protein YcfJ